MRKIVLCLLLLTAPVVLAQEAGKPPEINDYVKADRPYGTGSVTFLFMSIYDASLWTDARPFSWEEPFALSLYYRHNLTTKELVSKTLQLMTSVGNVSSEQAATYGPQLTRLWPDMNDGDITTAIYQPGGKTIFYYNGQLRGSIDDPAFGRPFFDIWLSPKTTEPAAREGLLSGNR